MNTRIVAPDPHHQSINQYFPDQGSTCWIHLVIC